MFLTVKFLIVGFGESSEVYDFNTRTWGTWPSTPIQTGNTPCMVTWKDAFIVFGGSGSPLSVQRYNITTQVNTSF
jgi:hypothetical protein